jgi:adenylate kinase family enzyme
MAHLAIDFCCAKDFPQFHHVSTGDLLRNHVKNQTPLGLDAKKYMDAGKLVPDEVMIGLVIEEATPNLELGKSLLLDGFPRNVNQAKALEEVVHIDLVINLDVPTDTIVDRIADRYVFQSFHLFRSACSKVFQLFARGKRSGIQDRVV